MSDRLASIHKRLAFIYNDEQADIYTEKIKNLCDSYSNQLHEPAKRTRYSEKDIILITYPDQIADGSFPKFTVLKTFLDRFLKDTVNTVHILPCFPYSSDDGFSIINYKEIADDLGGWDAFKELSAEYNVMADCVLNHISAQSEWVIKYCAGNPDYADFFIEEDPQRDLSMTNRPRTLPLLHPFETADGSSQDLPRLQRQLIGQLDVAQALSQDVARPFASGSEHGDLVRRERVLVQQAM